MTSYHNNSKRRREVKNVWKACRRIASNPDEQNALRSALFQRYIGRHLRRMPTQLHRGEQLHEL